MPPAIPLRDRRLRTDADSDRDQVSAPRRLAASIGVDTPATVPTPGSASPATGQTNRLLVLFGSTAIVSLAHCALLVARASGPEGSGIAAMASPALVALLAIALGVRAVRTGARGEQAWRLAVGFLVVVSVLVSVQRWFVMPPGGGGWSPLAVLMTLFPVLVPCTPRRALAAELAALGITTLLCAVSLFVTGPIDVVVLASVLQGEVLAVPLAVAASHVVHGLGQRLAEEERLGAYVLEEWLGAGGMGEVWRARHARLANPVAIKLVRSEAAGWGFETRGMALGRFEREARAAASLSDPHTITIHDYGTTRDGRLYYAMELLDGIDLHDLVARYGVMPPERVVHVLRQACSSLGEAHRLGFVHRDVKPSNLMLCRLGEEVDYLKVLDFGLVTRETLRPFEDLLTTSGNITGTPGFMSPEQVRGETVDGRSDLYALGCVAYWLLTGGLVFHGDTPVDLALQHVVAEPEPPSRRAPLPIPPELDALVLQLLARDPDARVQSARELSQRLAGLPLVDPWTERRAWDWWDRSVGPRHPAAPRRPRASSVVVPLPSATPASTWVGP